MHKQDYNIEGMTCASCVARVEKALKKIEDVVEANVNLSVEKAFIKSQKPIAAPVLKHAIEKTGFEVVTQQFDLNIEGMTCASCVGRVERKLGKLEGVTASVNLPLNSAAVTVPEGISDQDLLAAVDKPK